MATTRPYRIHFNGEVRMVEATHRSAAIAHLASELVADCRPAKASEVAAHCRNGGTVEVANAQAEAESKAMPNADQAETEGGYFPKPSLDGQAE